MGIIQNAIWKMQHNSRCRKHEEEYVVLLPMIANETRNYIQKISNSSVIPELAKLLNQEGIPEFFEVTEWELSWRYKDSTQAKSIQFKHMGLPNLSTAHKYSTQIDGGMWWAFDKENKSYINRLMESVRSGGTFQKDHPDLFGISSYDSAPNDDDFRMRPCINECVVIGVLLCRSMNVIYTYEWSMVGAKFMRKYAHTRSW